MATMVDPAHPGETLRECIAGEGLTVTGAAERLALSRATLHRLLAGQTGITAAHALSFERCGWSNAEFWMRRQAAYDLALARRESAA